MLIKKSDLKGLVEEVRTELAITDAIVERMVKPLTTISNSKFKELISSIYGKEALEGFVSAEPDGNKPKFKDGKIISTYDVTYNELDGIGKPTGSTDTHPWEVIFYNGVINLEN
jgi:hypothetical protein